MIESGSPLSTTTIIKRILANRELFEKRNQEKQEKELRRIEAAEKREEAAKTRAETGQT